MFISLVGDLATAVLRQDEQRPHAYLPGAIG